MTEEPCAVAALLATLAAFLVAAAHFVAAFGSGLAGLTLLVCVLPVCCRRGWTSSVFSP